MVRDSGEGGGWRERRHRGEEREGQGNLDKILPGVDSQSVGLEPCLHQRGGVGGRDVVQKVHTPCVKIKIKLHCTEL